MALKLRQKTQANSYDTLTNKGDELTHDETDNDFLYLYNLIRNLNPIGVVKQYFGTSDPDGWLICDGRTIGVQGSIADVADVKLKKLFVHLWDLSKTSTNKLTATDGSGTPVTLDGSAPSGATAWAGLYVISLPDFKGKFAKGAASKTEVFGTGGANSFDATHGHTNTLATSSAGGHTHNISDDTDSAGTHNHTGSITINADGDHNHNDAGHQHNVPVNPIAITEGGAAQAVLYSAPQIASDMGNAVIANDGSHSHTGTTTINNGGAHTHPINVSTDNNGAHTHPLTGSVDNTPITVNTVPPYIDVNYIINYMAAVIV